jgi:replicative DNA helicase
VHSLEQWVHEYSNAIRKREIEFDLAQYNAQNPNLVRDNPNAAEVVRYLAAKELNQLESPLKGKVSEANRLTDAEYRRIAMAGFEWEKSHFIREYCGVVDIDRLRLIINKMVYQDGCEYIVIDYLQRMQIKAGHGQNTAFAIAQICAEIKAMATQHDVGIILLSQLNRSNEKESQVRIPKITDLRDSGGIEEVADTVTLLHRPDIYEDDPRDANGNSLKNMMMIISAKNRDGEPDMGYFILCNMGTNQYFNENERHLWEESFHINPNKIEYDEPRQIQPNANVPF